MPVNHPGYAAIQDVYLNTPSLTAGGMACRHYLVPDTLTSFHEVRQRCWQTLGHRQFSDHGRMPTQRVAGENLVAATIVKAIGCRFASINSKAYPRYTRIARTHITHRTSQPPGQCHPFLHYNRQNPGSTPSAGNQQRARHGALPAHIVMTHSAYLQTL